ncbi:uncharacterized protein V6R79_020489 [Siganus canaliculatus]
MTENVLVFKCLHQYAVKEQRVSGTAGISCSSTECCFKQQKDHLQNKLCLISAVVKMTSMTPQLLESQTRRNHVNKCLKHVEWRQLNCYSDLQRDGGRTEKRNVNFSQKKNQDETEDEIQTDRSTNITTKMNNKRVKIPSTSHEEGKITQRIYTCQKQSFRKQRSVSNILLERNSLKEKNKLRKTQLLSPPSSFPPNTEGHCHSGDELEPGPDQDQDQDQTRTRTRTRTRPGPGPGPDHGQDQDQTRTRQARQGSKQTLWHILTRRRMQTSPGRSRDRHVKRRRRLLHRCHCCLFKNKNKNMANKRTCCRARTQTHRLIHILNTLCSGAGKKRAVGDLLANILKFYVQLENDLVFKPHSDP